MLIRDIEEAAELLRQARPTAVNLAWALERLLRVAADEELEALNDVREALLAHAQRIADEDVEINRRMGANGAALLEDGDTVLHHCNTGALATVDYGTALGVIRAAHEQGKNIHVLVDETRPRLQGARLTTWELQRLGVPFDLIADNAAGHFMRTGQVQAVLVGSDRTAANGDVANKIGTYNWVLSPAKMVFPSTQWSRRQRLISRSPPAMKFRSRNAIRAKCWNSHSRGAAAVPSGITARTLPSTSRPHKYVTAIVTEQSVVYPPFKRNLAQAVRAELPSD